jgi:hypothetical protein
MSDLVGRTPVGATQILELDSSVAQGLDVPSGATLALISIEGSIRWRDDGSAPTPSQGHPMGDEHMIYGGALNQLRFIAQAGFRNDPIVTASFYR